MKLGDATTDSIPVDLPGGAMSTPEPGWSSGSSPDSYPTYAPPTPDIATPDAGVSQSGTSGSVDWGKLLDTAANVYSKVATSQAQVDIAKINAQRGLTYPYSYATTGYRGIGTGYNVPSLSTFGLPGTAPAYGVQANNTVFYIALAALAAGALYALR